MISNSYRLALIYGNGKLLFFKSFYVLVSSNFNKKMFFMTQ